MYGTVLATHFMRHNAVPGGKIIVTGSIVGVHILPTLPEHAAAKAGAHHFARSIAPVLKHKENITINIVMPGPYDSSAMPDFVDAFLPEHLTTKKCLLSAYDKFIEDEANEKNGQAVETAHDKLFFHDLPGYKHGDVSKRSEEIYEPWFAGFHGELSGIEGTIQGPHGKNKRKVIAVTGATGSQGGGVVNVMKKTPGWTVRAITRNPESSAAQKLATDGVEVVAANFDDESSLAKAFKGVHAIFAVTNWWEPLFSGKTQEECSAIEEEQGMTLVRAAASVPTLEHYIWSTTPTPKYRLAGTKNATLRVPHMDAKAKVDDRLKAEHPDLAAKTTYLYFGYYPQNMAIFPFLKPVKQPDTGKLVQVVASKPDAKVLLSGDMTVNPGIWVRQVLASGAKAHGRYANVALEKWSFQQMVDVWSEVTGKQLTYIQCTPEDWEKEWGLAARELSYQFKFGEICDPWEEQDGFLTPDDLGIDANEVVGFRGTIESLKSFF